MFRLQLESFYEFSSHYTCTADLLNTFFIQLSISDLSVATLMFGYSFYLWERNQHFVDVACTTDSISISCRVGRLGGITWGGV